MCSLELVSLQATMKRTLIVAFDTFTGEHAVKRVCFGTPLTEVNLRQWQEEVGPFDPQKWVSHWLTHYHVSGIMPDSPMSP